MNGWIAVALSAVSLILWILLLRQVRGMRKEKKTPEGGADREARLFKLYQEIESMLDSFDQYVSEVHDELERERSALNETARQAQMLLMQAMEKAAAVEKLAAAPPQETVAPQGTVSPPASTGNAPPAGNKKKKAPPAKGQGAPAEKAPPAEKGPPDEQTDASSEKKDPTEPKPSASRLSDRERQTLAGMDSKAKRVRFLMSRGFAVGEVARELDIGVGEVRLIADLDRT